MKSLMGTVLSRGMAAGRIYCYEKNEIGEQLKGDPSEEQERLLKAFDKAKESLGRLCETSGRDFGQKNAEIFEAQKQLLSDEGFISLILKKIKEEDMSARRAVLETGEEYAVKFEMTDDEYIRARADDIRDVSERVAALLNENDEAGEKRKIPADAIIMAERILPSEAVYPAANAAGLVMTEGTAVSHTAILMRSKHIPVISGIAVDKSLDGHPAVLDAEKGQLIVDPDEETISEIKTRTSPAGLNSAFDEIKRIVSETKGRMKLYANINGPEDAKKAMECGAEGVGLFRTEYVYINSDHLPSEEEQFEVYKQAAEYTQGKKLIVRTADLGGDKLPQYMHDDDDDASEEMRGIRRSLKYPDILGMQLRAILRSSIYGDVSIMLPMIRTMEEVEECKKYLDKAKEELRKRNIPFDENIPMGIMIETPEAARESGRLSAMADFFSIGTNDLTQYTLGVDRCGMSGDMQRGHYDPAVRELIRLTIGNAHRAGISVSVCGEMAGEIRGAEILKEMGADILSLSL